MQHIRNLHFSHIKSKPTLPAYQVAPVMSDSATLWTVAHQAPLSVGFSRQEYWRLLSPPSGDLPDPGIEPRSLMSPELQVGSLPLASRGKPKIDNKKMNIQIEE